MDAAPTTTPAADQKTLSAEDTKMLKSLSRKKSTLKNSFKLRSESLNSLRLRRVFDLFDKNHDNLITVDEISQALILLGLEADPEELQSIVSSFIKQGCDGLSYDDFVSLHESLSGTFFDCDDPHPDELVDEIDQQAVPDIEDEKEQVESDLTEAFKVFDEDGDGFISAKELQQVLFKLGLPEAQQELDHIQLMISSVDQNRDGRVDFFEFKHMMLRSVLVPSS